MTKLTDWQIAAARAWGDMGMYIDTDTTLGDLEVACVGDTMFMGMMRELDPVEGCGSWTEAAHRLESLKDDLEEVTRAFNKEMPEEGTTDGT